MQQIKMKELDKQHLFWLQAFLLLMQDISINLHNIQLVILMMEVILDMEDDEMVTDLMVLEVAEV